MEQPIEGGTMTAAATAPVEFEEKRGEPRLKLGPKYLATIHLEDLSVPARMTDISIGGFGALVQHEFKLYDVVRVDLDIGKCGPNDYGMLRTLAYPVDSKRVGTFNRVGFGFSMMSEVEYERLLKIILYYRFAVSL